MSRLQPHFSYRDLCRAYLGPTATAPECDFAWFHIARYPAPLDACEDRLAEFCDGLIDPLGALQRRRAKEARAYLANDCSPRVDTSRGAPE